MNHRLKFTFIEQEKDERVHRTYGKYHLINKQLFMTIITRNNYEEFFLDYIEEEISAQNKELLEAFLVQHPDLKGVGRNDG